MMIIIILVILPDDQVAKHKRRSWSQKTLWGSSKAESHVKEIINEVVHLDDENNDDDDDDYQYDDYDHDDYENADAYILKVGISGNRVFVNFFHFPPKFRLRTRKPSRLHCTIALCG